MPTEQPTAESGHTKVEEPPKRGNRVFRLLIVLGVGVVAFAWYKNDSITGLTTALVFVGTAQAWVYFKQSQIMAAQAKLTREAIDVSKDSADAQAGLMREQAEIAKNQAAIFKEQVAAAEKQIKEMHEARDETIKANAFIRESSFRQLRAYLSAGDAMAVENEIGGIKLRDFRKWQISIKNHGQTPALRVRVETGCDILDERISSFEVLQRWDKDPGSSGDVLPEQSFVSFTDLGAFYPDERIIRADKVLGGPIIYVYGRLTFTDVFGFRNVTTFCLFYDNRERRFTLEKYGNETNYHYPA